VAARTREPLHLVDAPAPAAQVDHGVAVGAHRPQVGHRVNLVLGADLRKRLDVVDVNERLSFKAINPRFLLKYDE
jgi:hypothetical protein